MRDKTTFSRDQKHREKEIPCWIGISFYEEKEEKINRMKGLDGGQSTIESVLM